MSDAVRETIQDKVVAILAEQAALEPSAVPMEASLADLGIDSLALVETIFGIEEAFEIEVPFNANEPDKSDFDISTVASIVRAVESLVAARA